MNTMFLLFGLLVLAYIGSFLVSGRAIRGFGLPSGAEYLALGFVVGPFGLGILDQTTLTAFAPIAHVALGWLAFVVGLEYGVVAGRPVRLSRIALGVAASAFVGLFVAFAVWAAVVRTMPLSQADQLWLSGAVGAACAETTRHAVRWVVERHQARGPLSEFVAELSASDDLAPFLAVAVLLVLRPSTPHAYHLSDGTLLLITLGLGPALAATVAALLVHEFRLEETWGILLGAAMLALGTAIRLGLSSLAVMFLMGLSLAALSAHREGLRTLVAPTEQPVLLPMLLLAGANIDLKATPVLAVLVAVALCARTLGKWVVGVALTASKDARRAGPMLGLGLLSSGSLSVSIGLGFALRFPGPVGDSVLVVAAAASVLGEFVAPTMLSRILKNADEIPQEDLAIRSEVAP